MSILSYFQELVSLIENFAEFGLYLATGPSVLVAGFAAVGGLFAGPLGALCGGMAGSTLNSFMSNSLNPAIGVLNNLSFAQKKNSCSWRAGFGWICFCGRSRYIHGK